jgi:hypothetical protein
MDFNRRNMGQAAEKEAATRRATEAQILEDAERLIAAWNERQAKRMPMLFLPTIGAVITAGYGSCGSAVRLAARRTRFTCARSIRHPDAAATSLMPPLSCRSCRPNAPFADRAAVADQHRLTKCWRSTSAGFLASTKDTVRNDLRPPV